MKLSELTVKPKLIKLTIDDEDIINEFGEPIEFYIYDRQNMTTFMKLATISQDNIGGLSNVVAELVLDENGKKILADEMMPPVNVMLKVINTVVDNLGNLTKSTTQK